MASNQGDPAKLIDLLQAPLASWCCLDLGPLDPDLMCEARPSRQRTSTDEAAIELQRMFYYRGIVGSDSIGGALWRFGTRQIVFALSGDKTKAKTAYQDRLWRRR